MHNILLGTLIKDFKPISKYVNFIISLNQVFWVRMLLTEHMNMCFIITLVTKLYAESSKVLGADSLKTNQNTRRSHKVLKGLCVFQSKVSPTLDF